MSRILDQAAKADPQRAADLAANDALLKTEPRVLKVFGVQIKRGASVRTQCEAMGFSSCEVTAQHMDLRADDEVIVVRAKQSIAGSCTECTVCGGDAAPGESKLCDYCRGLAATFARVAELA